MVRELRSRKVSTEAKNGATMTKVEKTEVKSKRKAPAQSESPIPRKLQKGAKNAIVKDADEPAAKVTKTTKTKTLASKEPDVEEPELLAESDSEEEEQEDEEQAQKLAAELDPEEEEATEDATVYKTGQAVGKIPDVSDAVAKAAKATSDGDSGVIYIGRIPHGFYEHEMRQYLSQFGPINKLRLSRSKKTGNSKHYAFVEFAEATTAEIVAKTMNNYLLFGHILKCKMIPKEQVHSSLFRGANHRFKKVPWNKMAGKELEKPRSEAQWEKKVALEQKKRAQKAAKLKEMGYEFDAPTIKDVPPPGAVFEEPIEEVRAIEETTEQANGDNTEAQVEVTEKVVTKGPSEEVEVEVKSISAPKTKTKTKVAKSKKIKA